MVKNKRVAFVSTLMMLFLVSFVQAREIRISTGGWPPFLSQEQRHNGFIAHLISDIFAEADIKVNYVFRPWARIYQETAVGAYDATAVWMDAEDRHADFLYSDAVLDETFVFFYRLDESFDWSAFKDLAGLKVGGDLGYSYGPKFDAALDAGVFTMERMHDPGLNFKKLLRGRIDIYPQERSVGYYLLRHDLAAENVDKITHHPQPLLVNQSFLLFPHKGAKSLELLAIFNRGLAKFKADGHYQAYFDAFNRGEYEN